MKKTSQAQSRSAAVFGVLALLVMFLVIRERSVLRADQRSTRVSPVSVPLSSSAADPGLAKVRVQQLLLVERLEGAAAQARSEGRLQLAETLGSQAEFLRGSFVPATLRRTGPHADRDWSIASADSCLQKPCLYFVLADTGSSQPALAQWHPGKTMRVLEADVAEAFGHPVALSLLVRELSHAQWTFAHGDWGLDPPKITKETPLPDHDAAYAAQAAVLDMRLGDAFSAAVQATSERIAQGSVRPMRSLTYDVVYLPVDAAPPLPDADSLSLRRKKALSDAWQEIFLVSVNAARAAGAKERATLVARLLLGFSAPDADVRLP